MLPTVVIVRSNLGIDFSNSRAWDARIEKLIQNSKVNHYQ